MLSPGLEMYIRAFIELSTCRPLYQGGLGPIPWVAIDAYARRHGLRGREFEDLASITRTMDDAFMKHQIKKMKEKT